MPDQITYCDCALCQEIKKRYDETKVPEFPKLKEIESSENSEPDPKRDSK